MYIVFPLPRIVIKFIYEHAITKLGWLYLTPIQVSLFLLVTKTYLFSGIILFLGKGYSFRS